MTRNWISAIKHAVAVCSSRPRIVLMVALLMGAALLVMPGLVPVAEAQACCRVTAVSGKSASAVETKTETTFLFTLTKPVSLHVGDAVYANFPKKEVSCDGRSICGTITSITLGAAGTTTGSPLAVHPAQIPVVPPSASANQAPTGGSTRVVSGSSASSCTPTTCAAQNATCGSIADGCGGTLSCGSCTAPATSAITAVPSAVNKTPGLSPAATQVAVVPPLAPANQAPTGGSAPVASPPTNTSTIPGRKVPMESLGLDPDRAGALQRTSLNFTGPGTCRGSFSVDEQSSSLNVEVDGDLPSNGTPFLGCTMTAELYKGVQLQNNWTVVNDEFGCSTDSRVNIPPGSCEWISKPSGRSPEGQVSITLPHSFNPPEGTLPCVSANNPCLLSIVGSVVITLQGKADSSPYPPVASLRAPILPVRLPGPGNTSGSTTSGSASTGSAPASGTAPANATVCAGSSTLEGVDVSSGNGTVNWTQVKASGRKFAYVLATQGTYFTNTLFAPNYAAVKAAGLVRGAIHLFDPTVNGTSQANYFLSVMGTIQPGDLPPAMELGPLNNGNSGAVSGSVLLAGVDQWMTVVKAATGLTPIVFSDPTMLEQAPGSGFSADPLWIESYGVTCPLVPVGWHQWVFWQSSSTGTVPGISGPVDLDEFNGTLKELKALAKP